MIEYVEIDDTREIRQINTDLGDKLRKALTRTETRIIGGPGGNFKSRVYFANRTGQEALYWASRPREDKKTAKNFFGHGIPGENATLNLDVQLNVPVLGFSRRTGGVFLRHLRSGKVALAHRGIATLGHGRVLKTSLFREMRRFQMDVKTSKGVRKLLLISRLDSPTLINDIDKFSSALRQAAKLAKARTATTTAKPFDSRKTSRVPRILSGSLRKYFSEFSGKYKVVGREPTTADRHHGDVVAAIKNAFVEPAEKLKNQAIDLVVATKTHILLFEVKTSVKSQSLFTAIGQLAVHAKAVAKYEPSKTLVRVMVLPARVEPTFCDLLELEIELIVYSRSSKGHISLRDDKHLLSAN